DVHMLPAPFRRTAVALAILAFSAPFGSAQPSSGIVPNSAVSLDALGPLPSFSRTGVIYDRVAPVAHLERLDGSGDTPVLTAGAWRQAWDEIRRASLVPPPGPDLDALAAGVRAAQREGVIPIAILDYAFERIRPEAMTDGTVRIENDRIAGVTRSPLIETRAFAAAALVPRTYRGSSVAFRLASS